MAFTTTGAAATASVKDPVEAGDVPERVEPRRRRRPRADRDVVAHLGRAQGDRPPDLTGAQHAQ